MREPSTYVGQLRTVMLIETAVAASATSNVSTSAIVTATDANSLHPPSRGGRYGHPMPTEVRAPLSPRVKRSVLALLGGNVLTTSAVMAETTALGKQVYDLTGHVFSLGLLGLAEFAPAALLVLVRGAVADRFERRRVAAIAMACE